MLESIESDIVIVGGGISGLGVLLEAAKRGWKSILFEKETLSSATSASSLRIIHGGFRYLQTLDIPRVIESCRDQQSLLSTYPQFIKPLPCVMPLRGTGMKSWYPALAGTLFFKALARIFCGVDVKASCLDSAHLKSNLPFLGKDAPHGALYWTDALLTDPSGFAECLREEASGSGCVVVEETSVQRVIPCGDYFDVETVGKKGIRSVRTRVVVNATGPWLSCVETTACRPDILWCKAFNLILRRQFHAEYAVGVPGDTRLYFLVPRDGVSVLGTDYIPFRGNPDDACVTRDEIASFLGEFNSVFPSWPISPTDVESVECGVLPMRGLRNNYPRLYGLERIYQDDRLIEVLSTKYTTFRSQARKVAARAGQFLSQ